MLQTHACEIVPPRRQLMFTKYRSTEQWGGIAGPTGWLVDFDLLSSVGNMFFFVEWDGVVLSDAAGLCSLQLGSPEVVEYLHDHVRFKLFAEPPFMRWKRKWKLMSPERKPQSEQCYVYYIQQSKTTFCTLVSWIKWHAFSHPSSWEKQTDRSSLHTLFT